MGFLQWVGYAIAGLAPAYVAMLYLLQEKLVYVPVIPGVPKGYPYTPKRFGLWYENIKLIAKDGVKIHGWLIKSHADRKGPTIVFLQENAGNIAHRMENVMQLIARLNVNVFILSYRGYGESEGVPSEQGIKLDAQAALDHLLARDDVDPNAIVLFGRSLGGAVASWLASENPTTVKAVLLENTFISIPALAPTLLPLLGFFIGHQRRPLNWIVKSKWRGIDYVQEVLCPVLFLSGGRDEMVPQWHMQELYKVHRSPRCRWVDFPEGRHMDMWQAEETYWDEVSSFFKDVLVTDPQ